MSASDPPLDPRGVRFAAALSTVGYLTGLTALGVTATAFALAAAFLNAFGFGREMHALIHRYLNRNQQGATA